VCRVPKPASSASEPNPRRRVLRQTMTDHDNEQ
jgi:hypothetical protein